MQFYAAKSLTNLYVTTNGSSNNCVFNLNEFPFDFDIPSGTQTGVSLIGSPTVSIGGYDYTLSLSYGFPNATLTFIPQGSAPINPPGGALVTFGITAFFPNLTA